MKTSAITPFVAPFLAVAVACSSGGPTSTNVVYSQSANEIKTAAIELWNDWLAATKAHDASAVYSLFSRNVTDHCTVEQMEHFFAMDDDAFTYPEMDVKEVFLAPGNSEQAFMTMELRNQPGNDQQGVRDTYVVSIPYPIVREDGRWLMVFQFPFSIDGCPFVGEFSSQEATTAEGSTPTRP
ncbi:MAG: hypothetical protein BZY87_02255 [SAR202 cluster bacterium Io17-Chloro-G6]|nr:MAG: hypothetical protein BZY87_02255 [SAR202 cluster bacterium Io17-Chloro-G6]